MIFVKFYKRRPGANPTIVSYNASAVKIYNATGSLVRFENKNIFFWLEKRSSILQHTRLFALLLLIVELTPEQVDNNEKNMYCLPHKI
jgi:hypothetical protein